jgi:hypothetical protein
MRVEHSVLAYTTGILQYWHINQTRCTFDVTVSQRLFYNKYTQHDGICHHSSLIVDICSVVLKSNLTHNYVSNGARDVDIAVAETTSD